MRKDRRNLESNGRQQAAGNGGDDPTTSKTQDLYAKLTPSVGVRCPTILPHLIPLY